MSQKGSYKMKVNIFRLLMPSPCLEGLEDLLDETGLKLGDIVRYGKVSQTNLEGF